MSYPYRKGEQVKGKEEQRSAKKNKSVFQQLEKIHHPTGSSLQLKVSMAKA